MNFWETNNGYSAMEFLLQALDTLCDAQNKANQIAKERNAIEREKLELLQKKAPEIMEQPDHEIRKDDSYQWANRKSDPYQWLINNPRLTLPSGRLKRGLAKPDESAYPACKRNDGVKAPGC